MSETLTAQLSHESKLIIASNMAVAQAVLELAAAQKGGAPMVSAESRVLGLVKSALQRVDELAT